MTARRKKPNIYGRRFESRGLLNSSRSNPSPSRLILGHNRLRCDDG